MSTTCLVANCRDCAWHVVKGGKLDCNHEDRLGLGRPKLAQIIEEEIEEKEEKPP